MPPAGPPSYRGGPLSASDDAATRSAIRVLSAEGLIDGAVATAAWEQVLELPQWEGEPGWLHGDLMPGNLRLVTAGSPAPSTSA